MKKFIDSIGKLSSARFKSKKTQWKPSHIFEKRNDYVDKFKSWKDQGIDNVNTLKRRSVEVQESATNIRQEITKRAGTTLETGKKALVDNTSEPLKHLKLGENIVKNSVKETVTYAESSVKDTMRQAKRFILTAIFVGCFAYGVGKEVPKLIHKEYKEWKKSPDTKVVGDGEGILGKLVKEK